MLGLNNLPLVVNEYLTVEKSGKKTWTGERSRKKNWLWHVTAAGVVLCIRIS